MSLRTRDQVESPPTTQQALKEAKGTNQMQHINTKYMVIKGPLMLLLACRSI